MSIFHISILDIVLAVAGWVFLFEAFRLFGQKRFLWLHFFLFFIPWITLCIFTFFPGFRSRVGDVFGVERWADVLVYTSIIVLFFAVIYLFRRVEYEKQKVTLLVRKIALDTASAPQKSSCTHHE